MNKPDKMGKRKPPRAIMVVSTVLCVGILLFFAVLFFVFSPFAVNQFRGVDIDDHLNPKVAKSLNAYRPIYNYNDSGWLDPHLAVFYENVDKKTLETILKENPQNILLNCGDKKSSNDQCFNKWLTMNEMWNYRAKSDPRTLAYDKPELLSKLKLLEDTPGTLCSLKSDSKLNKLTTGEESYATGRAVYLCINPGLHMLLFESWSS